MELLTLFPLVPNDATWDALLASETASLQILARFTDRALLDVEQIKRGTNLVYRAHNGEIVKIFPPLTREQFECERIVLPMLQGRLSIATPTLIEVKEIDGWGMIRMSALAGSDLSLCWSELTLDERYALLRQIGTVMREVHELRLNLTELQPWPCEGEMIVDYALRRHERHRLPEHLLEEVTRWLKAHEPPSSSREVLLTGEYTPENLLVEIVDGKLSLTGMIDFGDCLKGPSAYDLLGPSTFLTPGNIVGLTELWKGYGRDYESSIDAMRRELMWRLLTHRYANLSFQLRLRDWERSRSIEELSLRIWP